MAELDEHTYQKLLHGKELDFDALLRIVSEYQSALESYSATSDSIDSKAGVILSATIAISLASIAYIFAQNVSDINTVILSLYSLALIVSGAFCVRVLWARKQVIGGAIPKLRDSNFSLSRQVIENPKGLPSDRERQLVKLDKLDAACRHMKPVVHTKSSAIKAAQNIFALSSGAVFLVYFVTLLCRLV